MDWMSGAHSGLSASAGGTASREGCAAQQAPPRFSHPRIREALTESPKDKRLSAAARPAADGSVRWPGSRQRCHGCAAVRRRSLAGKHRRPARDRPRARREKSPLGAPAGAWPAPQAAGAVPSAQSAREGGRERAARGAGLRAPLPQEGARVEGWNNFWSRRRPRRRRPADCAPVAA